MHPQFLSLRRLTPAAVLLALLSACGGSDTPAPRPVSPPTVATATLPTAATAKSDVVISGLSFVDASTVSVDWGDKTAPVTLTLPVTSVSHKYEAAGKYTVKFTITSSTGKVGTTTYAVTVAPAIPSLNDTVVVPTTGEAGTELKITGLGFTNAESSAITINWGEEGGANVQLPITTTELAYTYEKAGKYNITITITPSAGTPVVKTFPIDVKPAVPVIAATFPPSGEVGVDVKVTGLSILKANGATATIDWGDKSPPVLEALALTATEASHTYEASGAYTIKITVTPLEGNPVVLSDNVSIGGAASVAATFPASAVFQKDSVKVTGISLSGAPGFTASINWGDGSTDPLTAATTEISHAYANAGSYTITITVTNPNPLSMPATKSGQVVVKNLATDLFFSEYMEGSAGNNKFIEIYNGTGADVDLFTYSIKLYANGASAATATLPLTGTLKRGEARVYYNNASAGAAISTTVYYLQTFMDGIGAVSVSGSVSATAVCNFNGDDALELVKAGVVVDSIGQIGNRGTGGGWGATTTATTLNALIRRKDTVFTGRTASTSAFDPTLEWVKVTPIEDSTDMGKHTFTSQ